MANTEQGAETSLSKGAEAAVDTDVKKPVCPKQMPEALSIHESTAHPMPNSSP